MRFLVLGLLAVAADSSSAEAGTVTGQVFIDADGNGLFSAGEEAAPGVVVAWETSRFVTTDETGAYTLEAPDSEGIVWVRTPDGFSPAPVWATVGPSDAEIDLGLKPAAATGPVTFVVGSDTHIGKDELGLDDELDTWDFERSIDQAVDLEPLPHFLVITGDIVQSNRPEQFEMVKEVAAVVSVPLVPVPGNHDWFDGGASYREHMGPPMYAFDAGGAHFVVLNDNVSISTTASFLAAELALPRAAGPVIAFVHQVPKDSELAVLEGAGVEYVFTGHWHSNMTLEFGELVELNTEPLIRGGIDGTPAGYRVMSLVDGDLTGAHRTVVDWPFVEIMQPRAPDCVVGTSVEVIVAAHVGATIPSVTIEAGDASVPLEPIGGWDFTGTVAIPEDGPIVLTASVRLTDGTDIEARQELARCSVEFDGVVGEWPALQGGPQHEGVAERVVAPPVATVWTRALGGHIVAPATVSGGRVFVGVNDFDRGAAGAVVALDAATGAEQWRYVLGADVRASVSVSDGLVVIGAADGVVHGVDVETGEAVWTHDLGEGLERLTSLLHAPPTISDGVVYVGVHRRFAALDLATGDVIWEIDPAPGDLTLTTHAAAAIAGDQVVATVARGRAGAFALERGAGEERWRRSASQSVGIHATPVVGDGVVYFVNSVGEADAIDLVTGDTQWSTPVYEGAGEWDHIVLATPALADGILIVPGQYGDVVALDAATGACRWRTSTAEDAVLHSAHARSAVSSFASPPIVSGNVVWIGSNDGVLSALDLPTGSRFWSIALGSPITGGVTPAGDYLYVASFDGTVRAMSHPVGVPSVPPEPPPPSGCGCSTDDHRVPPSAPLLAGIVLWMLRRRR